MKISSAKIAIFFGAILSLAALLLSAYLTKYLVQKTKSLKVLSEEAGAVQALDQALRNADEIYESTKGEREMIDTLFVKSNNVVDFLDSLERDGQSVMPNFAYLSVEETRETPSRLLFTASAEGSFASAMKILEVLEKSRYPITLKNVSLQNGEGRQTDPAAPILWEMAFQAELPTFEGAATNKEEPPKEN